jgi:hypothetical protein
MTALNTVSPVSTLPSKFAYTKAAVDAPLLVTQLAAAGVAFKSLNVDLSAQVCTIYGLDPATSATTVTTVIANHTGDSAASKAAAAAAVTKFLGLDPKTATLEQVVSYLQGKAVP